MRKYDCVIVGSGPAGLGAAFYLKEKRPSASILILDRERTSTGGLRNDCKMNFTFPIGFPEDNWSQPDAEQHLEEVTRFLRPEIFEKRNLETYTGRAKRLGVRLLNIRQSHLGTDGGLKLIKQLMGELEHLGVELRLGEAVNGVDYETRTVRSANTQYGYDNLILAPGRKGFHFLQEMMDTLGIEYLDHIVDIGIRVETRLQNYGIVQDYYDPKFHFPDKVRTFCTNSGSAHVVQERYTTTGGKPYFSVNGHAYSDSKPPNGLVNFAMLKTVRFTEPLASGQEFAEMLGLQAMLMGGGKPIMQRVGDFRLGKRSTRHNFTEDLYDFRPTLPTCTPGDISLAMPARILRGIWKSMKLLDTIIPGVLHPSTIMYYPEIKLYANKPRFMDPHFQVRQGVYMIGDGAGTSRGITAAWASGIRAARGILNGWNDSIHSFP